MIIMKLNVWPDYRIDLFATLIATPQSDVNYYHIDG